MTGGKKSKRGTPQGGVVSPLLANIYINRLLRHWKKTGAYERLGQIVSYADDFVILCASWHQAEESLALVSRWLKRLGLAEEEVPGASLPASSASQGWRGDSLPF